MKGHRQADRDRFGRTLTDRQADEYGHIRQTATGRPRTNRGKGGQGRTEVHRGHAQTDTDRQRDPDGQRGTGTYKGDRRGQTRTNTYKGRSMRKHGQNTHKTNGTSLWIGRSVPVVAPLFTTITSMDQDRPFGSEKDRVEVR
uniref:Uncharacterized protein n=1 Tax=Haemonchus contortus TaxID=6289 RepID=A0A7I4Y288_HAECO